MREYQERRKVRKIIYSKWGFIFLFIVLIILVFSTSKIYVKSRNAALINEEISAALIELKNRELELESEVKRLQSESGIEREIRKRFNVGKPGEKVVIIVDKDEESNKIRQEKTGGFFLKTWRAIKKIFY